MKDFLEVVHLSTWKKNLLKQIYTHKYVCKYTQSHRHTLILNTLIVNEKLFPTDLTQKNKGPIKNTHHIHVCANIHLLLWRINRQARKNELGTFSLQLSSTSVLIRLSQLSLNQTGSLQHRQKQRNHWLMQTDYTEHISTTRNMTL